MTLMLFLHTKIRKGTDLQFLIFNTAFLAWNKAIMAYHYGQGILLKDDVTNVSIYLAIAEIFIAIQTLW